MKVYCDMIYVSILVSIVGFVSSFLFEFSIISTHESFYVGISLNIMCGGIISSVITFIQYLSSRHDILEEFIQQTMDALMKISNISTLIAHDEEIKTYEDVKNIIEYKIDIVSLKKSYNKIDFLLHKNKKNDIQKNIVEKIEKVNKILSVIEGEHELCDTKTVEPHIPQIYGLVDFMLRIELENEIEFKFKISYFQLVYEITKALVNVQCILYGKKIRDDPPKGFDRHMVPNDFDEKKYKKYAGYSY